MKEKIRRQVIIPQMLLLVVVMIFFVSAFYRFQLEQIDQEVQSQVNATSEQLYMEIDEDAELMTGLLDFIVQDEEICQAWLSKDRQKLLMATLPLFERIRSEYRVTHFCFHGLDRVNFLRVHNPEKNGDYIRRFTMGGAASTGKTSYGIELGQLGTLTLRVVYPWLIDGELAGYIELGEEIEHITQRMQNIQNLDYVILIFKEYIEREQWEYGMRLLNREENWDEYDQVAVIHRTIDVPAEQISPWLFRDHADHEGLLFSAETEEQHFRAGFAPLIDAGGREVGDILAFRNVTGQMASLTKVVRTVLIALALAATALLLFFWLYLGKIQFKMNASRSMLVDVKLKLEESNQQLTDKQKSLTRSIESLKSILSKVPFGVVLIDKQRTIRWMNETVQRMISAGSAKDIIGKKCTEYLCSAGQDHCPILDLNKEVDNSERILRTSEGIEIPIVKSVLEVNIDGEDMLLETFVEITERKRMEEERDASQKFMQTVIDGIAENLMVINLDYTIALANRGVLKLTDEPDPVAAGLKCHQLSHHCDTPCDSKSDPCPIEQLLATRAPVILEHTHYDADNNAISVEVIASPIFNEKGEVIQIIESSRNITERKRMETELGHARKLESVGQLAAGIAHEINTPAQFVSNNVNFFQESMEDVLKLIAGYQDMVNIAQERSMSTGEIAEIEKLLEEVDWDYLKEEIPSAIEQSQDGIDRIARIVRAMKEFSHPGNKEKVPKNLNEILETTVIVARSEWKYVAEMQLDLLADLPQVNCLVDEMGQVFLNIIVNAAQAIGENSNGNGKGLIKVNSAVQDECVEIRIEDSGGGIPASVQENVFDPFFTTKDVGKGTGQGLTIAYDVVTTKHGGTLAFDTTEGKGTTFTVRLPLMEKEA